MMSELYWYWVRIDENYVFLVTLCVSGGGIGQAVQQVLR